MLLEDIIVLALGYASPLPVNNPSQQNRPFGVSSSAVGDSYGGPTAESDYDYSYDSYDDEYTNAAPNGENYGAPQGKLYGLKIFVGIIEKLGLSQDVTR